MWVAWAAATASGGLVYGLMISISFGVVPHSLTTSTPPPAALIVRLSVVANPFFAAALASIPPALLVGRLTAPEHRATRMVWWVIASGVGGFLIIAYLLVDITGPVTWDEIRYWYAPVTAIVAFLTTSAQALALLRLVSRFTLAFYIPITTIGWVIGWSLEILNSPGSDIPDISVVLWFALPFLCIGICSGLVLAHQLSKRRYI